MFKEVSITDKIETCPVVTTGVRWATADEANQAESYFKSFPESKEDPLRNDFGSVDAFPPAFSRGGGLFPVLILMDDGRLCCAMRTGAPHVGSGGEISLSLSEDRGQNWSDYRVAVRGDPENDLDLINLTFGQSENGDLVLAYGVMVGMDAKGQSAGELYFKSIEVIRSGDEGETWSDPVKVPFPHGVSLSPHGQMRRLGDGTLVFNSRGDYRKSEYEKDPDLPPRMTYLYWSRDGGKSWEEPTLVKVGLSETGFLPLDDEHWVAYLRSNEKANRIAHSYDNGVSWTRWEKGAFSEGSEDVDVYGRIVNSRFQWASPGSIAALPNGKVIITYGFRAHPFGVRAIISHDGGDNFDLTHEYILSDTGYHPDCGYPSTVCFEDGTIVTTAYTIMDIDHPEWGTSCLAYRYHQDLFN